MIGKAVSLTHQKFTVVVLAGGSGSRLGQQSQYLPKALTQLGNQRALDFIIQRYKNIAAKFVIGVGIHHDLIENYIRGRYPDSLLEFSYESQLHSDAVSLIHCLDHVDSRLPVIICFCDLIMLGNTVITPDVMYYTNSATLGVTGTFRHGLITDHDGYVLEVTKQDPPNNIGIIGQFVVGNTVKLKEIAYHNYDTVKDLTRHIISPYSKQVRMKSVAVESVIEFGDEMTLDKARKQWEKLV